MIRDQATMFKRYFWKQKVKKKEKLGKHTENQELQIKKKRKKKENEFSLLRKALKR